MHSVENFEAIVHPLFFFLEQLFIHFFKTKKTVSLPLILFKISFIYINIYNFYYSANFLIIMTYEREEH